MKKLLLLLIIPFLSFGQVKYGLKAGVNFHNDQLVTNNNSDYAIGFLFGGFARINISNKLISFNY